MQARPAFAHAQNLQRALMQLQRQQGGARFGLDHEFWDWLRLGMNRDCMCNRHPHNLLGASQFNLVMDLLLVHIKTPR